ncbi:Lin0368 family putative glycerol transporter subunit [Neobacillus niacini]|uniref:Lin0368 family putative glycerol transporter subunit n=1 Tax=Neobacillus niacini TaxID=86668 RepID=UPI003982F21F
MKFSRGVIGYCIAGMIVMSVWGPLSSKYGLMGGVLAAFFIIGPMWYMNHYVGLIDHEDDSAFVDMGLGIAICGMMRDFFMNGSSTLVDSLPTILLVTVGAVAGGVAAAYIEKDMAKKNVEHAEIVIEQKKTA